MTTSNSTMLADDSQIKSYWRPQTPLGKFGFVILNLWIGLHILSVIAAPISVSPSSRLEGQLWTNLRPYVQLLYLNNGYHYFAPDPGGSNSVTYVAELADGTIIEDKFPHRQIWPRLLYHRHFMLSEFLGTLQGPNREVMTRDFARQICRDHNAERVTLFLQWHELPLRERIIAGGSLFDDDLYQETPLGTFTWDELSKSSPEKSATTADK